MNHNRLLSSLSPALLALGLGAVVGLAGCASDPPPEPVGQDVAAICSSGSDGADDCIARDGYCSAACGVCFQSVQQKIELKNLWMCDPATIGGGGGGGGAGGSLVKCATKSSDWRDTKDEARNQASDRARDACRLLVDIGTPCTEDVASASCTYSWWYGTHQCTARFCAD